MLDGKGPLLFINSVTSDAEANNQQVYDTRNPPKQSNSYRDLRKLNNIVEMYNKNRPVLCNLITKTVNLKATPFRIDPNYVYVKTFEGKEEKIDINSLEKIEILRF